MEVMRSSQEVLLTIVEVRGVGLSGHPQNLETWNSSALTCVRVFGL